MARAPTVNAEAEAPVEAPAWVVLKHWERAVIGDVVRLQDGADALVEAGILRPAEPRDIALRTYVKEL